MDLLEFKRLVEADTKGFFGDAAEAIAAEEIPADMDLADWYTFFIGSVVLCRLAAQSSAPRPENPLFSGAPPKRVIR